MRRIDTFILHCSATHPGQDIGAETIRGWHRDQGWDDIGYHFVIRRDGAIENGRPIDQVGAHARGHNRHSIGICLVGGVSKSGQAESNFTRAQWRSLERLESGLRFTFPDAKITGHRDLPNVSKSCPSFDAEAW